ncbi:MAG: PIN domain-containing protein [Deltaproteobacteria bacterium]|nr:PIN domain-containing protein [Deltaproteobacteria bacterium]
MLLSAAAGRAARRVFEGGFDIKVVTTEATLAEVEEYLPTIADQYGLPAAQLTRVLAELSLIVYGQPVYETALPEATKRIGARDPDDAALLALALVLGCPVWTNDRDFEDVGVSTYTTAQLLKTLAS